MKLALVGYGKMGKALHRLATERGHTISYIVDKQNEDDIEKINHENTDVVIEFSEPHSAFQNIMTCLKKKVRIISGTTGWLEHLPQVIETTQSKDTTFLYASNFSLGVNIFFGLNEFLAKNMNGKNNFDISISEIHHTEKRDSPSGTAVTLAEGIIKNNDEKENWVNSKSSKKEEISILSYREHNVPGTHTVLYKSKDEIIEIKHTAQNRDIFASGAIDVAEWIVTKTGYLTMSAYLNDMK